MNLIYSSYYEESGTYYQNQSLTETTSSYSYGDFKWSSYLNGENYSGTWREASLSNKLVTYASYDHTSAPLGIYDVLAVLIKISSLNTTTGAETPVNSEVYSVTLGNQHTMFGGTSGSANLDTELLNYAEAESNPEGTYKWIVRLDGVVTGFPGDVELDLGIQTQLFTKTGLLTDGTIDPLAPTSKELISIINDWPEAEVKAYLMSPTYTPEASHVFSNIASSIIAETDVSFEGDIKFVNDQVVFDTVVGVGRTVVFADSASTLLWANDLEFALPVPQMGLRLYYSNSVFESPEAYPFILNNSYPIFFPSWTLRSNIPKLETALNSFFIESFNQFFGQEYLYQIQKFLTMEPLTVPTAINDKDTEIEILDGQHWLPSKIYSSSIFTYPIRPIAFNKGYYTDIYNADLYCIVSTANASGVHDLTEVLDSNPISDTGCFIVVDSLGETSVISQFHPSYDRVNKSLDIGFSPAAIYYQSTVLQSILKNKSLRLSGRTIEGQSYNKSLIGGWSLSVPNLYNDYSSTRLRELQYQYPKTRGMFTKIALLLNKTEYNSYTVDASVALNSTDEVLGEKYKVFKQKLSKIGTEYFSNVFSASDSAKFITQEGVFFNTSDIIGEGDAFYLNTMFTQTSIPKLNSGKFYNEVITQTAVTGSNTTKRETHFNWDKTDIAANEFSYF